MYSVCWSVILIWLTEYTVRRTECRVLTAILLSRLHYMSRFESITLHVLVFLHWGGYTHNICLALIFSLSRIRLAGMLALPSKHFCSQQRQCRLPGALHGSIECQIHVTVVLCAARGPCNGSIECKVHATVVSSARSM